VNGDASHTMEGIVGHTGVILAGAGLLTNYAIVGGYIGVSATGAGTVINHGIIEGIDTPSFSGAGVVIAGAGIVINYGVIEGLYGAPAVQFSGAGGRLVAEAGSSFYGALQGSGDDTLVVAGGNGTITRLGSGTGTLSGAVSANFSDFGRYGVSDGGTWTLAGGGILSAGERLNDDATIVNAGDLQVEAGGILYMAGGNLSGGSLEVAAHGRLFTTGASVINGVAITNAGTLGTQSGSLTIEGDVVNNGLLCMPGGDLIITGQVSGSGKAKLSGAGVLEVDGAMSERVVFAAASTGALILGDTAGFTGSVAGFSTTGANSIDLKNVAYDAADTVSYKADKLKPTKGGTLTVDDSSGNRIASLKLSGDFTSSTFTLSNGGADGTVITDPASPSTSEVAALPNASAHAFVAAMAAMGHGSGEALVSTHSFAPVHILLARP
jgi:hypothetical protein